VCIFFHNMLSFITRNIVKATSCTLQAVFTLQYKGSADVTLCLRTPAIFNNKSCLLRTRNIKRTEAAKYRQDATFVIFVLEIIVNCPLVSDDRITNMNRDANAPCYLSDVHWCFSTAKWQWKSVH
jgi:hypothetical protein